MSLYSTVLRPSLLIEAWAFANISSKASSCFQQGKVNQSMSVEDDRRCLSSSMPPAPLTAAVVGASCHLPCDVLYGPLRPHFSAAYLSAGREA